MKRFILVIVGLIGVLLAAVMVLYILSVILQ